MIVLVCGGRGFGLDEAKRNFIYASLDKFAEENSIHYKPDDSWLPLDIKIVAGKARGTDQVAVDWAIINWLTFQEYPADWKKYGRAAGAIRNRQMLDEAKPDIVLAFPGGRGTAHMKKIARNAGVPIKEYTYNGEG